MNTEEITKALWNIEAVRERIDKYETSELAQDFKINFFNIWKDVKFSEIIAEYKKLGSDDASTAKYELWARIDWFTTFGLDDNKSDRDRLRIKAAIEKAVDEELGTNIYDIDFKHKTPEEIIDEWEEEERWEQEEKEHQETIDEVAKWAYNDGICDSLGEAYLLAEMTY